MLFVPAEGVEAYSLRVHPAHPCHVAWVWNPGSFTPWQRRVVERAMGQARETLPAGWPAEPQQVRVLESADHVGIQLFGVSDPDPIFSLTLRKHDLSTVQVGVVGSRKDW